VVRTLPSGLKEVCLLVDGVRCNGCVLLIEKTLMAIPGVSVAQVNALSRRARIVFDDALTQLPVLIGQLQQAGYRSHPLNAQSLTDIRRDESRDLLKRLVVAGFGMMQTMMF